MLKHLQCTIGRKESCIDKIPIIIMQSTDQHLTSYNYIVLYYHIRGNQNYWTLGDIVQSWGKLQPTRFKNARLAVKFVVHKIDCSAFIR